MKRRLATPLFLLFCTALLIVLLPGSTSAGFLGLSPEESPSLSVSNPDRPGRASGLRPTDWMTTTLGAELDSWGIGLTRRGNPKMGTSLNLLYDAYRDDGRSGAQQFAYQHLMVADGRRVQVEVTADVDAMAAIREAIEALGGEYQGHHRTLLQAMVPFEALGALAGQPQVWFVRQPLRAMPEEPSAVGAETSEGVDASSASAWHAAGYDGSGVKVAVVDSGFEGYAALLGTELPASVQTRDYTGEGMGGSEHGAGCAEIVHDMAPGADMYLYKVSTMVELSRAVDDLIAENVDIISMSLGWPIDGPGDGTGYLADIVNRARMNGIVFVKSAGNEAERSWSGRYQDSGNNTHRWSQQADVNAFGPEPGRCYRVDEGDQIRFALHWDDWTYVNQDYDLYMVRWTGSAWEVVQASTKTQDGRAGQEPTEVINILAPSEACYGAVVHRASATRDVCLRLSAKDSDGNPLVYTVPSRSLSFPGDSPDAFTVGAVDVTSPPAYPLEPYSSQGPTFGPGGACTGGALKPDIAAYARVSTDSYGPTGFAGTSAACPHVAGASALVKQANPLYTVSDLQNFLEGRAIDQGPAGKDSMYGAGRLHLGPPPEVGTPTSTLTATPTRTRTPTRTPTPTRTSPPTLTRERTRVYLPIVLRSFHGVLRPTPTDTQPGEPTPTHTTASTATSTPTETATPTGTETRSATSTSTATPSATPTRPTAGWTTIVSEDFEGDFPGQWFVFDNVLGYGEYGWGKRDCRPYGGAYSGWAVGAGAQGSQLSCGSNYPDNAESWMVYGPFSLVDAEAAELALKVWLNTELDHDYIGYYASINGQNFYGWYRGGRDQQWDDVVFDLRDVYVLGDLMGQPEVWVALVFGSDDGRHYPEGCYVDDIVLRKCTSAECASSVGAAAEPVGVQLSAVPGLKKLVMARPVGLDVGPLSSIDRGGWLP